LTDLSQLNASVENFELSVARYREKRQISFSSGLSPDYSDQFF
jgi:hypothetical protein